MRLSRREFTLRKCPTREGSSACRKLPPMRRTSALREVPRLAAVRQRICEGDLLLGFCGKVPSKARRTRKSRGSLLCVNDRGLPQFDNALRRKSSAKKEHKKTRPYPQATDIVAKSSGFVKCLMQNSPKNSPFARSARTTGELLQKKMTTLLQLCAGFFTKVCYDIAR